MKQTTNSTTVNRNLQLPKYVWDALDKDAERCGRSGVKQLLALLTAYYGLGNVELDPEGLERMRLASIPLGNKQSTTDAETIPNKPYIPRNPPAPITFNKKGGRKS